MPKTAWLMRKAAIFALLGALLAGETRSQEMATERQAMVEEIAARVSSVGGRGLDPRVLAVLGRVPRHEFVSPSLRASAYANRPLPIGHGQTVSQPYIVAAMTGLLRTGDGETALEIGTGSGYQAAVLAELGVRVYSIEIVEPLAHEAATRLRRLGYSRVETRVGDGYHGWPERGPFDVIVVTAAASHVPPPLVQQLKPGGRMVIPVGMPFQTQQLMLVEKRSDGTLTIRQLMAVSFVPLTGGHN